MFVFGPALQKSTEGESLNTQAEIVSVKAAVFSTPPNSDGDCLTKENSSAKRSLFLLEGNMERLGLPCKFKLNLGTRPESSDA